MKKMGLNEIREKYLQFFETKEHLRMESASLVPVNDPSLLLINSGMAPLKAFFTGSETPPRNRVTTCQKCIRTPDIENVGITARHGTFFEMLGNFSFGDYFKEQAIPWAWEFVTEVMEMPIDKLWVTIYEDDDEAKDIWIKTGVAPDRIVRMGKADNFWEHGTGPCGPCSEIYFDRGEENGCKSADCKIGCECDRFIEFWNLVFTQFDKHEDGSYSKLAKPNIDTGMGLERLACVMQGVENLFEVDTVKNILDAVCALADTGYKKNIKKDISIRVITDHIRSTTMMISDGVIPSNEGRGYVLRRLLRRAARHGKLLGINGLFLSGLADIVIAESGSAYPNLVEKNEYIKKIILVEEEKFNATIDMGLNILQNYINEAEKTGVKILSGLDVFKLHDTYGFPIDLTKEIAMEYGDTVDEEGFKKAMLEQKQRARDAIKDRSSSWSGDAQIEGVDKVTSTEFTGYTSTKSEAEIQYIIKDMQAVNEAEEGDLISIILDKTPFYAEMGGQAADCGMIKSRNAVAKVIDCKKTPEGKYIHIAEITEGNFSKGERVEAEIDMSNRLDIARNHTATHLVQAALKNVLGNHIQQAGSSVDSEHLRFDFSHFQAMTKEELQQVENQVNEKIFENLEVLCREMQIDEAKKLGAMALFGEKYGNVVRVVSAGEYSVEFCGGIHVGNTSQISMVKIVSESGIAAGTRRIEAITGRKVLQYLNNREDLVSEVADVLKTIKTDVVKKAIQLANEYKEATREINELKTKIIKSALDNVLVQVKEIKGTKVLVAVLEGQDANVLRETGDMIKNRLGDNSALVLISPTEEKVNLIAMANKEAVAKGINAGNVIREVAKCVGGGGGGRPDIAQAGGKDPSKVEDAVKVAYRVIENVLEEKGGK